ncbi:MAG: fumarylacetoacetate hydrolase family protein [Chloroflexi bacterium]|nr:fumarylacetoacetate hydrolase family protein [Chloroflexota bacterium]MBV9602416.1 fumarylacetoacetate hydrolase family protein [Chloroflexota bacterium]
MKLVTFAVSGPTGSQRRLGALVGERIVDLTTAYATHLAEQTDEPTPRELAQLRTPPDLIGWLRGQHRSREAAEAALQFTRSRADDARGLDDARLSFGRHEVRLLAPLPRPTSLRDFSIFAEHMTRREGGAPPKRDSWYRRPPYYKGNPDSIIGPEDAIPFPYYSDKLDLELEIGIVVGRGGRNLSLDAARQAIAGYTILIDCSARDPYLFESEFLGPGKMKDWATVLGPCMVTADEIDEANLDVRICVDGEVWFEGNTSAPRSFLAHHLVAYVSDNETLQPGDVLGTGTVSYSCSVDLHRWPQVGQRVTFEVAGIGTLEHQIVAGEHAVDYVRNGMDGLLKP